MTTSETVNLDAPKVSTEDNDGYVKMLPGFKRPEVLAKARETQRLNREAAKATLEQVANGVDGIPLPAHARQGVINAAASIAQDSQADIKDRVSALNALTKLTERHDSTTDAIERELREFITRIRANPITPHAGA